MFGGMPAGRDLRIAGNDVEMDSFLRARNAGLDVAPYISFICLVLWIPLTTRCSRTTSLTELRSQNSQSPHCGEVKQSRGHAGLNSAAQQFVPPPVQKRQLGTPLDSRRDLDHNAAPSPHVINNGYRGTDPRRLPRLYPAHAPSTSAQTIQDCIDRVLGIEANRVHTTLMPPILRGNRRGPMYGDLISHSLNCSPPLSTKQKAEQEQEKRVKKSEKRGRSEWRERRSGRRRNRRARARMTKKSAMRSREDK